MTADVLGRCCQDNVVPSHGFLISPEVTCASMNPSSNQKPNGTMAMKPKSPELLAKGGMNPQKIHQPIASGAKETIDHRRTDPVADPRRDLMPRDS